MTYFRRTFAQSGDKAAVPIDDPSDGSVSYQTGYGPNYSQDPTTVGTARRVERNKYNQILSDITTEIQRYQQNAYPEFITTSDNGGSPFSYSKGATVRYSGSVYRSLIDSNTDLPTEISSWYNLDSLRPTLVAKSADYEITDTDNIKAIPVTTGAANILITLPLLANNLGRLVTVSKADSGTGKFTLDGNGSETINGALTQEVNGQNGEITVLATVSGWLILHHTSYATLSVAGSGDYTAGTLKISKINNLIAITSTSALTHSSTANAASAAGLVPTWAVPVVNMRFFIANTREFLVNTDGSIGSSAPTAQTTTNFPVHSTYAFF